MPIRTRRAARFAEEIVQRETVLNIDTAKGAVFPADIQIYISDFLTVNELVRLRAVSRAFLSAARARVDSKVVIEFSAPEPNDSEVWRPRLKRLSKPVNARRIRSLTVRYRQFRSQKDHAYVVDIMKAAINITVLRFHLGNVACVSAIPSGTWCGAFQQVVEFELITTPECLKKFEMSNLKMPNLQKFNLATHGCWWRRVNTIDETLLKDDIIPFINRHSEQLRSLRIFPRASDLPLPGEVFRALLRPLPRVQVLDICASWLADDHSATGPEAALADTLSECLPHLQTLSIVRRRGDNPVGHYFPELLRRVEPRTLVMTSLKLNVKFEATRQLCSWLVPVIPLLQTLWLSEVELGVVHFTWISDELQETSQKRGLRMRSLLLNVHRDIVEKLGGFNSVRNSFPGVHDLRLKTVGAWPLAEDSRKHLPRKVLESQRSTLFEQLMEDKGFYRYREGKPSWPRHYFVVRELLTVDPAVEGEEQVLMDDLEDGYDSVTYTVGNPRGKPCECKHCSNQRKRPWEAWPDHF